MAEAASHLVVSLLADAIALAADLQRPAVPSEGERCELWAHDADDRFAPADRGTYSIVRSYASPPLGGEPNRIALQIYTRAASVKKAMSRGVVLVNVLLDGGDDAQPIKAWDIGEQPDAFTIDVFELTEPALIARDDNGWSEVASNVELSYRRIAAP